MLIKTPFRQATFIKPIKSYMKTNKKKSVLNGVRTKNRFTL